MTLESMSLNIININKFNLNNHCNIPNNNINQKFGCTLEFGNNRLSHYTMCNQRWRLERRNIIQVLIELYLTSQFGKTNFSHKVITL